MNLLNFKIDLSAVSIATLTAKISKAIIPQIEVIMSITQEEIAAQLLAMADQQAMASAALSEAIGELSTLPDQIVAQSANIDALNAEIKTLQDQIAAGTPPAVLSPALLAAFDAVVAGQPAINDMATKLANVVVVVPPVV